MGWKYQIFVSSTFQDLKDERKAVQWEILKTDNIPVGMESFTADDDRGWGVIKRSIESSDYYILILAGRYGSVDEKFGMSWTEHEYDYAIKLRIPILVFMRDDDYITAKKLESDTELLAKLNTFKEKVRSRHLIEYWTTLDDLRARTSTALTKRFRLDEEKVPRPGWFRGGSTMGRPIHSTRMRYYHVHMRATGSLEDCQNGRCRLQYWGSGLVESPKVPVRFEDRVKDAFPVESYTTFPKGMILNPDEFKRNPANLQYAIQAADNLPELFIHGEIVSYTRIS